jgi:hypothetical protein
MRKNRRWGGTGLRCGCFCSLNGLLAQRNIYFNGNRTVNVNTILGVLIYLLHASSPPPTSTAHGLCILIPSFDAFDSTFAIPALAYKTDAKELFTHVYFSSLNTLSPTLSSSLLDLLSVYANAFAS